jgi:ABC-type lipoprotein export system ATPase subunit
LGFGSVMTSESSLRGDALVELRAVGFSVRRPAPTRILYPMDLTVRRGSSLAVFGPSGAGKTTLVSIIGGLQPATEGAYHFSGIDILNLVSRQVARFRAENIGFVFQNSHLIDERNAWRNVSLGLTESALQRVEVEQLSRDVLTSVGLAHIADREAGLLSGGERQRVAVARAIVKRPKLLIADEPTGSLDQQNGQSILDLLFSLPSTGTTLIVASHDERVATLAQHFITIVDGRLQN